MSFVLYKSAIIIKIQKNTLQETLKAQQLENIQQANINYQQGEMISRLEESLVINKREEGLVTTERVCESEDMETGINEINCIVPILYKMS